MTSGSSFQAQLGRIERAKEKHLQWENSQFWSALIFLLFWKIQPQWAVAYEHGTIYPYLPAPMNMLGINRMCTENIFLLH